ncbi:MAG: hypothetical protein E7261_13070 [Lachnospiraceae bacterium]|nr:hypothetical protein [Lachnospiraceae bacterium]
MKREKIKKIFVQVIGAVAAVCCPVYGYFPIAMAFFAAAYRCISTRFVIPFVMFGAFFVRTDVETEVKYGICMLVSAIIYELIIRKKGKLRNAVASFVMACVLWLVEAAGGFMTAEPFWYVVLGGFEAAVVIGLSGILHMALSSKILTGTGLKDSVYMPAGTEMVATGIFVAMLVYALDNIAIGPVSAAEVVIYLLILIYSYRYGAGMGGVIGTACGTVMTFISENTAYLGMFCLLGVVVGFFNYIGKFASMLAYFACLWILALLYAPFILEVGHLQGLIAAAGIFLALPMKFSFSYKQADFEAPDVERIKYGTSRMLETASVFRRLADSVRRINKEDDGVFATELQLKVAAGTLEEISRSMLAGDTEDEQAPICEAVRKAFAGKGYNVKRLDFKKGSKDEGIIRMTLRTERGNVETVKEAAGIISGVLKKSYKPTEGCRTIINGDYAGYTFTEEPAFMMLHGNAAITKNGEDVSGDNFTFTELGTGEVLIGIVDGMGSGVAAGEDSEIVIELLEELLKAGFDEEAALALINSVLLTRKEEQSLAAIDMAVGDLYTGRFNFVKLGAAATFIKRNRWVEVLQSTNYPIGILKEVDYESTVKKLYDGDYIVMVSDGILDAVAKSEKEELLSEWISEYDKKNPKEFAKYILNKAIAEAKGSVCDDMTVLVAGIWTKHS